MRTITLGIATYLSLLLNLGAVEAKPYFSPRRLTFQPRSRYFLVEQDRPTHQLAIEVLRGGASNKSAEEDEETDEESEIEVS